MITAISTRRLVLQGAAALVVTTLATRSGAAATPRNTPLAGTWQADVAQSKFKGRAPYRSGKMQFVAEDAGKVHVLCDVVTANGAVFHFEYDGPEDGTALPVTGNPYYNSASMLWKNSHTLVRTELRAGKPIGTSTIVLAPDGQSFLATASRSTPEDGHLYTSTILWKRVAD